MADVTTAAFSYSSTQDPVIKKFVDEVSDQMKVEIVQTLSAKKDPARYKMVAAPRIKVDDQEEDSVGSVIKDMFEALDKPKQEEALSRIASPQVFTAKMRMDVASNGIDLKSAKYAGEQINPAARFAFANERYLKSLGSRVSALMAQTQSNGAAATGQPNKKLNFRLHVVKCVDETGPEGFWGERLGSDAIDIGGTSVSDKGVTKKIDPFRVSSNFDDGESVTYNPARVLRSFPLDSNYPKTFSVLLAMAEKDRSGGFWSYINKLFDAVKTQVLSILKKIADKISQTLAKLFGGKLGQIISSIASMILSKIIDWLTGLFKNYDDIFEPQVVTIGLDKATATFNGSLSTSQRSLTYRKFLGEYMVMYSWELEK
jgi:hypothetical protein